MSRLFHCSAPVLMAGLLSACCACAPQSAPTRPATAVVPHVAAPLPVGPQAGDVLAVTVTGQGDLTGAYTVGPDGNITMPLVGRVAVAGQPDNALAGLIADAYRAGYLVNPEVRVEVKGR